MRQDMPKKPNKAKPKSPNYDKGMAAQAKARKEYMKNMTPAKRKEMDRLASIGKNVLLPASLAALPLGKAGSVGRGAKAVANTARAKVLIAQAERVAKTEGGALKGVGKAVVKDVKKTLKGINNLVKHPSGNLIDKRTGAVYDKNLKMIKPGSNANAAKYRARKIANSPAARDLKRASKKKVVRGAAGVAGAKMAYDRLNRG